MELLLDQSQSSIAPKALQLGPLAAQRDARYNVTRKAGGPCYKPVTVMMKLTLFLLFRRSSPSNSFLRDFCPLFSSPWRIITMVTL